MHLCHDIAGVYAVLLVLIHDRGHALSMDSYIHISLIVCLMLRLAQNKRLTILLAIFAIYFIDFSINAGKFLSLLI